MGFSADGLCAIDVTMRPGVNLELGNLHILKEAAATAIVGCVQGTGSGGSIGGLGMFEQSHTHTEL